MRNSKICRRTSHLPADAMSSSEIALRIIWKSGAEGFLDENLFRSIGIDPNLTFDGIPLLLAAAEGGHEKVVNILLSHPEIDPNLPAKSGVTPLLLAAQNGHFSVVNTLLAHPKIDPNCAALHEGVTPLFIAAQNGHLEIVRALLAHDETQADLPVDGISPVSVAIENGFEDIALAIHAHLKKKPTDASRIKIKAVPLELMH